ncbi:MAG: tRNA (adenosine(37)-N6)-dimethylallyltransferase MiaA [Clostridia bacterium]|nr:tRNA (adenosine(37)-N6)-dimethylallyltransferase MiaA [Clostridia bacterium]MBQ4157553.1 tRNA (adenosine(37)-N6)-dimethylallyltransferase MiaA [Clostridia bacterium]
MNKKIYGICGPTASGKTALAVEISAIIGGEVISCDSMQVYKGMDILSAKPSEEEKKGIVHHMMSVIDPIEKFSASAFREYAEPIISDIRNRGRIPILCGGTGLYIDSLTRGMRFSEKADEDLRNTLKAISEEAGGPERLHKELMEIDPESALKYPANDVRRVIRSIEIFRLTGLTRKQQEEADKNTPDRYQTKLFALDWNREVLYQRIDRRVDEMVANGLISEVSNLIKTGEENHPTALQAIGYKEIARALRGECAMSDAIVRTKTASRNYAKRQLTWFRRDERVEWIKPENKTIESIANEIADRIRLMEEEK